MNSIIIPPEKNIKLIGITGRSGSGKSTVASILDLNYSEVICEAFADDLKYAACCAFGIDINSFYAENRKEIVNNYWKVSPRQIAQFVGTELFRDNIGKLIPGIGSDFWIARLHGKLIGELEKNYGDETIPCDYTGFNIVIQDVRFQNEVDYIYANNGYIIHIIKEERKGERHEVGIPNHVSEKIEALNFDAYKTFVIRNNGTLKELENTVHSFASLAELKSINS